MQMHTNTQHHQAHSHSIEHVKEPYSSVIDLRSKQGPGTSCYVDPPTCLWAHANYCQVLDISGKTKVTKPIQFAGSKINFLT